MVHFSKTPPNMSSIGAVCDSPGETSLTSLVGNYGATDGLRVNSYPVKGEFIIFALFFLEENAILRMTAGADRAPCDGHPWDTGKEINIVKDRAQSIPELLKSWWLPQLILFLSLINLKLGLYKMYNIYNRKMY